MLLQHSASPAQGLFNPPADAPGEAGETRGSWQSRLPLFTPFPLRFPPLSSLVPGLPSTSVTNQPCISGWLQAGEESVLDAVACCKCCTVLFMLFFNPDCNLCLCKERKKKTKTNKLYQNYRELLGCFAGERAGGMRQTLAVLQLSPCPPWLSVPRSRAALRLGGGSGTRAASAQHRRGRNC